jgi:hypothetical protein
MPQGCFNVRKVRLKYVHMADVVPLLMVPIQNGGRWK